MNHSEDTHSIPGGAKRTREALVHLADPLWDFAETRVQALHPDNWQAHISEQPAEALEKAYVALQLLHDLQDPELRAWQGHMVHELTLVMDQLHTAADDFSEGDAYRALDSIDRLLQVLGASEDLQGLIEDLRLDQLDVFFEQLAVSAASPTQSASELRDALISASNQERIGKAMELLVTHLRPMLAEKLELPEPFLDEDLSAPLLQAMQQGWDEHSLAQMLGQEAGRCYLDELLGMHQRWSHMSEHGEDDAYVYRVLDTALRLLQLADVADDLAAAELARHCVLESMVEQAPDAGVQLDDHHISDQSTGYQSCLRMALEVFQKGLTPFIEQEIRALYPSDNMEQRAYEAMRESRQFADRPEPEVNWRNHAGAMIAILLSRWEERFRWQLDPQIPDYNLRHLENIYSRWVRLDGGLGTEESIRAIDLMLQILQSAKASLSQTGRLRVLQDQIREMPPAPPVIDEDLTAEDDAALDMPDDASHLVDAEAGDAGEVPEAPDSEGSSESDDGGEESSKGSEAAAVADAEPGIAQEPAAADTAPAEDAKGDYEDAAATGADAGADTYSSAETDAAAETEDTPDHADDDDTTEDDGAAVEESYATDAEDSHGAEAEDSHDAEDPATTVAAGSAHAVQATDTLSHADAKDAAEEDATDAEDSHGAEAEDSHDAEDPATTVAAGSAHAVQSTDTLSHADAKDAAEEDATDAEDSHDTHAAEDEQATDAEDSDAPGSTAQATASAPVPDNRHIDPVAALENADADNHAHIGECLELLHDSLQPFVEARFSAMRGENWREQEQEILRGSSLAQAADTQQSRSKDDLGILLNLVKTRWSEVFLPSFGWSVYAYVCELMDVRTQWAFDRPFTDADLQRAIDTLMRLLGEISAPVQMAQVARLWQHTAPVLDARAIARRTDINRELALAEAEAAVTETERLQAEQVLMQEERALEEERSEQARVNHQAQQLELKRVETERDLATEQAATLHEETLRLETERDSAQAQASAEEAARQRIEAETRRTEAERKTALEKTAAENAATEHAQAQAAKLQAETTKLEAATQEANARQAAVAAETRQLEAKREVAEEQARAEQLAADRAKADTERLQAERAVAEARANAEQVEIQRLETEHRIQTEHLETTRRLENEQLETERKLEAERLEARNRQEAEQAEVRNRQEAEQAEVRNRQEVERIEAEGRQEKEKLDAQRKLAEERKASEKAEARRLNIQRKSATKQVEAAKAEVRRLETEQHAASEQATAAGAEARRLEMERDAARAQAARHQAGKLEAEARTAADQAETRRMETERGLTAERLALEQAQTANAEAQRLAHEAKTDAERAEMMRAEAERLAELARAEAERAVLLRAEAERNAAIEHLAEEQAHIQRIEAERAAAADSTLAAQAQAALAAEEVAITIAKTEAAKAEAMRADAQRAVLEKTRAEELARKQRAEAERLAALEISTAHKAESERAMAMEQAAAQWAEAERVAAARNATEMKTALEQAANLRAGPRQTLPGDGQYPDPHVQTAQARQRAAQLKAEMEKPAPPVASAGSSVSATQTQPADASDDYAASGDVSASLTAEAALELDRLQEARNEAIEKAAIAKEEMNRLEAARSSEEKLAQEAVAAAQQRMEEVTARQEAEYEAKVKELQEAKRRADQLAGERQVVSDEAQAQTDAPTDAPAADAPAASAAAPVADAAAAATDTAVQPTATPVTGTPLLSQAADTTAPEMPATPDLQSHTPVFMQASPETGALAAWQTILTLHPDLLTGHSRRPDFTPSLSRADSDPIAFFTRTCLTAGLRQLITATRDRLSRRSSDADHAIAELRANKGNGKTHAMCALRHLLTADDHAIPDSVHTLLDHAPLPETRCVLINGHGFAPQTTAARPDGTRVHTLWGEIAWQLGGPEAYASVSDHDTQGTCPPAQWLTDLLNAQGPCLLLIDDWDVYLSQLAEHPDAAGNSLDIQLNFAGALAEAVRNTRHSMLVFSMPNEQADNDPLLARLSRNVGATSSPWSAAGMDETCDIIRLRLFEPFDADVRAHRQTVADAFCQLYQQHPGSLPDATRRADYADKLRNCYPFHPEILYQLHSSWSLLPRFERTVSILQLLASVLLSLRESGVGQPLILPADISVIEPRVQFELSRYLPNQWTPVIEQDIDGPQSAPCQLDEQADEGGDTHQRLARAMYMGSAAQQVSEGVTEQHLHLCVMTPGGALPVQISQALQRLLAGAKHLYRNGDCYGYAIEPVLTRQVEAQAAQIRGDEDRMFAALTLHLKHGLRQAGRFVRVHVLPQSSADVLDDAAARLVVLGPSQSCDGNPDSEAERAARQLLKFHGSTARVFQNSLLLLAPDAEHLRHLNNALSLLLAWETMVENLPLMKLSAQQVAQAEAQHEAAAKKVQEQLMLTWKWLLVARQQSAAEQMELHLHQLSGAEPPALAASLWAEHNGQLITRMTGGQLLALMDEHRLWQGNHVKVRQLVESFAQHLWLPQVSGAEVIHRCHHGEH